MTSISQQRGALVEPTLSMVRPSTTATINTNAHSTLAGMLSGSAKSGMQVSVPMSDTSSTTGGDSGISSTDFLTLLVSELKNQDPTQPTDPNSYVQQLVGVNSLQQLIQINQDLTPTGTSGQGVDSTTGL